MRPAYPDISNILIARAQRRAALAAMSWEEKVAIIEQMRILLPRGSWKPVIAEEELPSQRRSPYPPDAGDGEHNFLLAMKEFTGRIVNSLPAQP